MKKRGEEVKALFFLNSFAGGGAEKVCLNLSEQLYKEKIESDYIIVFDEEADYDVPDYIRVFSLGIEDKPLECIKIVKSVPKVNAFIADNEYILITAHLQPAQLLAALSSVRGKCLFVIHHRVGNQPAWMRRMCLKYFLQKKRIITVSEGIANELSQTYGVELENIKVIYNPCGIMKLRARSDSKMLHDKQYILVIGRLIDSKNPLLALELYYRGRFYESHDLIYLGKGICESRIRRQIAAYGLEDHVILAGFQKNPERWIMNASLVLSCSKQEGFSMILVEALVCGVPVVSTDCPYGPREILVGELSEYLIDPEKEFNKSISVITSALESYPKITEKYYQKFDDRQIMQRYLDTWEKFFAEE